jgi:hypothetical protein
MSRGRDDDAWSIEPLSTPTPAVGALTPRPSVRARPPAGRGTEPPPSSSSPGGVANPKAHELARNFLAALFMGVRTAQIHDVGNRAFERAIELVREAAEQLHRATGGFTVVFADGAVFLNGHRLRVDGGAHEAMRTLARLLEQRGLGGVSLSSWPRLPVLRALLVHLAGAREEAVAAGDLAAVRELLVAPQALTDHAGGGLVDRRVFALQCYAKLVLVLRDLRTQPARGHAPRVRAVRLIQDLVELGSERADILLRLAHTHTGADVDDLHGANVCVLALALGQALGLARPQLVDLGVGALYHDVGRSPASAVAGVAPAGARGLAWEDETAEDALSLDDDDDDDDEGSRARTAPMALPRHQHPEEALGDAARAHPWSSFARVLAQAGTSRVGLMRAVIAGEHHIGPRDVDLWGVPRPLPTLLSRIVAVADAYDALIGGLASPAAEPLPPLEALASLLADADVRLDPRCVDLLINVLRAFPVGADVLLDSGERAVVRSHAGGTRWDRPVVQVQGVDGPRSVDLMRRTGDRFLLRIVSTTRFARAEAGA